MQGNFPNEQNEIAHEFSGGVMKTVKNILKQETGRFEIKAIK
jgi:hypothetical protein